MLWRLGPLATLYCLITNQLLVDDVKKGEALIDSIAVHPQSQGRGFGTALLKWCEATVAAEAEPGTSSNLYLWVRSRAAGCLRWAGWHHGTCLQLPDSRSQTPWLQQPGAHYHQTMSALAPAQLGRR